MQRLLEGEEQCHGNRTGAGNFWISQNGIGTERKCQQRSNDRGYTEVRVTRGSVMEECHCRGIDSKSDWEKNRTAWYCNESRQASKEAAQRIGPKSGDPFAFGLLAGLPSAFKPHQKPNGQRKTKALKNHICV